MPQAADSPAPWEKHLKPGYQAPGIPSRERKKTIPTLTAPQDWFLAEQEHRARRAGPHSDLRLFDGQTALSWAVRKGLPEPGKAHLALRQPDHCFPPGTLIATPEGPKPIESLKSGDEVFSMASDGSQVVRPVLRTFKRSAKKLVSFHVRNGNRGGTVLCTEEHEIFTDRGKISAGLLTSASRPLMMGYRLSADQLSVLLGTLLGDGSAGEGRVRIGHGKRQQSYSDYLSEALQANSLKDKDGDPWVYLYRDEVREIVKAFSFQRYVDGWFKLVGPRGLAILFCDDGSCTISGRKQRLWIEISTQCYSLEEIIAIQSWLSEEFDIESSVYSSHHDSRWHELPPQGSKKLYRLRVNRRRSVARFLHLVSPYIPSCMSYKIPSPDMVVTNSCKVCGKPIRRTRTVCSACLWNDARGKKPFNYSPSSGGLLWNHAVYARFGRWPVGEYPGPEETVPLRALLMSLERHTKSACSPGYIGAVTGIVRRPPKSVEYAGPVHNFEVKDTHNYVLANGLIVGNSPAYMMYEGPLGKGYGEGSVRVAQSGAIKVTDSSPDKIRFALLSAKNPQEFTMVRTPRYGEDHWLLLNTTPTVKSRPDLLPDKMNIKESPVTDIGHYMGRQYALSSKIDGGQVVVNFGPKRVEAFSHVPSVTGQLINHTYITGLDKVKPPAALAGTKIRAEVYAVQGNKVLPLRELGGLMNSTPARALDQMEEKNIRLFLAPLQVLQHKDKPAEALPYREQLKILETIVGKMPDNWRMPAVATTPAAKLKMMEQIKNKTHPLTEEGVVAWPLDGVGARPVKLKFKDHQQVYIRGVYPMMSGGKETALAGGFEYSLTPKGSVVGKCGTGFDLRLRKEIWDTRDELIGRKVVIESSGQHPSGAYRAPSFVSFHL